MFESFENKDDDFFNNCDIEMKEIDILYDEYEKLYNEKLDIEQKEKDIYTLYIMFSIVSYMLIIGSNLDNFTKKKCINYFFKKSISKNVNNFNVLDNVSMLD